MNKGFVAASAIGAVIGALAGVGSGILIGMKIRQKRADAEIDSIKASYRKAYKAQNAEVKESTEEKVSEEPGDGSQEKHLYDVLTEEKAKEMMDEDIEFIAFPVNEKGHHLYIPDDTLISVVGMTPKDIEEVINSTGDTIYVRNNRTGKYYEVFKSDEPDDI